MGRSSLVVEEVLDLRLDRREAGAAGHEDDRLVGVLAQVEGAQRALEAQDGALLHLLEDVAREGAARRLAHVQLQELVVVRRVGHGEAAPLAVLHQDVDVLAREELQPLAGGKLERDDRDVVGGLLHLLHAAGQRADREVLRAGELAHLEDDVGERPRAAGERLAGELLGVVQRALLVVAVDELARAQDALAGAAGAVAAAVRQADALAQGGLEDGFAGGDLERVAARLEPDRGGPTLGIQAIRAFVRRKGAAAAGAARASGVANLTARGHGPEG